MYIGNNRKGEYQAKRTALLDKTNTKLALEAKKKEAFRNALWADDIEKNTINLKQTPSTTINLGEIDKLKERIERSDMEKEDLLSRVFSTPVENDSRGRATTEVGDIGNEDDSVSDIDDESYSDVGGVRRPHHGDTEMEVDESDKRQAESYNYIKALFSKSTDLATMGIRPIMVNTGVFYNKQGKAIYLGKDARLETESGRKSKLDIDEIDWELTERYVNDVLKFKQSSNGRVPKSINKQIVMEVFKQNLKEGRERNNMGAEDVNVPISENLETDTEISYKDAIEKLLLNPENRKHAKRIGITPYDKNGSDRLRKKVRFHWQNNKLILYSDEQGKTARPTPAVERDQVSWYHTFNGLFERAAKEKIIFDTTGTSIISNSGAYNTKRALSDSTVSEGTYRPPIKSSRSIGTLTPKFEDEIKTKFRFNPSISELKISPIVKPKDQPEQFEQRYIFNHNGDLVYREKPDKMLTATDRTKLLKTIRWGSTHNYIMNEISESYNRLINIDPSRLSASDRVRITNLEHTLRRSTPMNTSDGHDTADIDDFSTRLAERGLKGRGLRGAGTTVRKAGRPFNLRDIQGSGTASALKYRELGSKFISLPHLDESKLKLVFANRTSVGRIQPISKELTDVIKELVYDGDVNQQKYQKLDHDDMTIFHEIVKACHLKYETKESLKEPREHLRAEFDKMKGQIMLGNDNPLMIKELKVLAIDMFNNGMISKTDFKQISLL